MTELSLLENVIWVSSLNRKIFLTSRRTVWSLIYDCSTDCINSFDMNFSLFETCLMLGCWVFRLPVQSQAFKVKFLSRLVWLLKSHVRVQTHREIIYESLCICFITERHKYWFYLYYCEGLWEYLHKIKIPYFQWEF